MKKALIFVIIFLFFSSSFTSVVGDSQDYNQNSNTIKLINIPITSKKIESISETINQKDQSGIPLNKIHPSFDLTKTGIHIAAYRDQELNKIVYIYSNNDGRTYQETSQNYFGDYPTIKHWGNKIFIGVTVTDEDDVQGNVIYLMFFEDPGNIESYSTYQIDPGIPGAPPFGKMRDSALACDNSQNNFYYWGAASYTINVGSHSYVPLLLYPEIPSSYLFKMTYYDIENCYHTDIDIDETRSTIYAVYDCYNTTFDTWKLYAREKDFLDLQNGFDNFFEIQNSEGLEYPVIATNDDTVLILAETQENGNKDIVCLRSTDGLSTVQKIFLTSSADDECFPEIEYAYGDTYYCTFTKNGNLYKIRSDNGGQTWSVPEIVDTNVVSEYKSVSISTSACQVIYEKNLGEEITYSVSPLRTYSNNPDLQIPSISGGNQIDVRLLNNGGSDESDIHWWINISGAVNKKLNGIIPLLNASEVHTITVDNLYGLGNINLKADFEVPVCQKISREIVGYINLNYIENIEFLWDVSKILYVDDSGVIGGIGTVDDPFRIIDSAYWASSHGDTIYVKEGTYYLVLPLSKLGILKSLQILGENKNKTFIDTDNVKLNACGNVYSGFTNLGTDLILYGEYNQAYDNIILGGKIFICGFSNCVTNNNINGSKWGIVFEESDGHHLVKQNLVENCSQVGIYSRGSSSNNIITSNELFNNGYGIFSDQLSYSYFTSNIAKDNLQGLGFNLLYKSVVKGNIIYDNIGGIGLTNSRNNVIESNDIENNIHGIYLEKSSNNRIIKNNFISNDNNAEFHHYSRFYHNTYFRNYWDDKGVFPIKVIYGQITFYIYSPFDPEAPPIPWTINWRNFDFFPSKIPYDI